jgi:hypothetical protein
MVLWQAPEIGRSLVFAFAMALVALIGGGGARAQTAASASSCTGRPDRAGIAANVTVALRVHFAAQQAATQGAQKLIPLLNARVAARAAREAAAAQRQPPTTLAARRTEADAADSAAIAALAAWMPLHDAWESTHDRLADLMDLAKVSAFDFPCLGVTVTPPPPVLYQCLQVYSGREVAIDSGGTLFAFLKLEGPRNVYACRPVTH